MNNFHGGEPLGGWLEIGLKEKGVEGVNVGG
jgi:hypothetical protein